MTLRRANTVDGIVVYADDADRRADLLRFEAQELAQRVRDLQSRVAGVYGRAAAEPARLAALDLDDMTDLLMDL